MFFALFSFFFCIESLSADDYYNTQVLPSNMTGDSFGRRVSVSGDFMAVSLQSAATNTGAVYTYRKQQQRWAELSTLTNDEESISFGSAHALDKEWLAVGAKEYNNLMGAVFLYHFDSHTNAFQRITHLLPSGEGSESSLFGHSVSLSYPHLVVGTLNQGKVYVFTYISSSSSWATTQIISQPENDAQPNDFGHKVKIHGNHLAISSPSSGTVHMYTLGRSRQWQLTQTLKIDDAEGAYFGMCVDIFEDNMVVTAPYQNSNEGAAYMFHRNEEANQWTMTTELSKLFVGSMDFFGTSCAISNGVVAVSSPTSEQSCTGKPMGSVSIFRKFQEKWNFASRVEPPCGEPTSEQSFGANLAMDDDHLAVGAMTASYVFSSYESCKDIDPYLSTGETVTALIFYLTVECTGAMTTTAATSWSDSMSKKFHTIHDLWIVFGSVVGIALVLTVVNLWLAYKLCWEGRNRNNGLVRVDEDPGAYLEEECFSEASIDEGEFTLDL